LEDIMACKPPMRYNSQGIERDTGGHLDVLERTA
jgi:hypothetical protein